MGLIDYFRILKALIILFLLFVRMNYIPNQNGKVLEETPAGFNSDDSPSFASSSEISPYSTVTLSHKIESIMNGSVDYGVTFKLVGYYFRKLGLVW